MLIKSEGLYRVSRILKLDPETAAFLKSRGEDFAKYIHGRFGYSLLVRPGAEETRLQKPGIEAHSWHDMLPDGFVVSWVSGPTKNRRYLQKISEHRFNEFDLALLEFVKTSVPASFRR